MSIRLALRYDMRAPAFGAPAAALYPAAVEQCAFADGVGFDTVYMAEHHGAEDGYCPSPIVLASAIAGRTKRMSMHFSALVAVLHNPLRLAEDLAVLDVISGGRVEMTLGIGYRQHEYDTFGIDRKRRVKILEETIGVFMQAWSGEEFDYQGLRVIVRPTPVQQPHPPVYIGGSTEASAVRAAKYGDNFMPATPDLFATFADECRRIGRVLPPSPRPKGPLFLFVTPDPDRDWPIVAPHVMYTSNSNAEWAKERGVGATPYPPISSVDEMRGNKSFAIVTPRQCVELVETMSPDVELTLHPLMGGLDPALGSASLELFASDVLPALEASRRWVRPAPGSRSVPTGMPS